MSHHRAVTLASRPKGVPTESDFRLIEEPTRSPGEGECLVKGLYLSVDPYMRGRMSDRESYAPPVALGDVMVGSVVGRVVESREPSLPAGAYVVSDLGWREYATAPASSLRKFDPQWGPISTALGVLGMPGLTAYFGMHDICAPQPGETCLVSGAAGAVGSAAGQIAKIAGARVIGVAGSDEKISWLTGELGFDAAFNYKKVDNYGAKLRELCPDGVTAISTTSAAISPTPRWPASLSALAWPSAVRSPGTTPRSPKWPRVGCSIWSSSARSCAASSSATSPSASPKAFTR